MLYGTPNEIQIIPVQGTTDLRVAIDPELEQLIIDNNGDEALKIAKEAEATADEALAKANQALANAPGQPFSSLEIWIDSTGTGGDGTLFNPYHCSNSFDLMDLFSSLSTYTNVTFHFLPGSFYVDSPGIKPNTGWKFYGAGMDNTILTMRSNSAAGIGCGVFNNFSRSDSVEIKDMTIDCNLQNQNTPSWVAAIRIIGSFTLIERIKPINWGGITAECFVIAIGNDLVSPNINPIIRDCIVTQPAPMVHGDGSTAISIHADGPGITGMNKGGGIYNCCVYDVDAGSGLSGSPNYFHAYSDIVEESVAINLTGATSVGVYRDSANGANAATSRVKNCTFINVTKGIYYNMPSAHQTGLLIQGNYIEVGENGYGIEYYRGAVPADPPAWADGVQLLDNVVVPYSTSTVVTAVLLDIDRVGTVIGNVFQGIGGGFDFNSPNQNTFIGNANLAGQLQPALYTGTGDPNGVVVGRPGDSYNEINAGVFAAQWQKQTGVNTNTGWV